MAKITEVFLLSAAPGNSPHRASWRWLVEKPRKGHLSILLDSLQTATSTVRRSKPY
ncbi:hypothetical protein SynMITS9220_02648 [Synechococcus sp. MIT S9220]|nr:hypothetical protein SynMITS9220_02648 [Synechococcus sp. MIT S9220]